MIFHYTSTIIHFAIRTKDANKIIFFIENLSHFRFIKNIFEYFVNEGYAIDVICFELPFNADKYKYGNINIITLKNDIEKIKLLKNIKGKIFITTTPSIGTAIFPKSKIIPKSDRPKYLYFFHSLVSPNEMYVKNSFKNFDFIFSPSLIISAQLKTLVGIKTKVFTTGYLMFNNIKLGKYSDTYDNKVLIAPTWGEGGVNQIINNMSKIIDFVKNISLDIVFRPHPMTKIERYKFSKEISVDRNKDLDDLHRYKYLITDYSGIALEFFYLTKRPVLFLEVPKKIKRSLSKKEQGFNLIENEMRNVIGNEVNMNDLVSLKEFPSVNNDSGIKFIQNSNFSANSLDKTIQVFKDESLI
tara:strand:+ start:785 stop:1852 length:1068 start_codon:yes stop_codon:yes gene_type:complete